MEGKVGIDWGRANAKMLTYKVLNKNINATEIKTWKKQIFIKMKPLLWLLGFRRTWKKTHKQVIENVLWAQRLELSDPWLCSSRGFFFLPHTNTSSFEETKALPFPFSSEPREGTHFPGWKAVLGISCYFQWQMNGGGWEEAFVDLPHLACKYRQGRFHCAAPRIPCKGREKVSIPCERESPALASNHLISSPNPTYIFCKKFPKPDPIQRSHRYSKHSLH